MKKADSADPSDSPEESGPCCAICGVLSAMQDVFQIVVFFALGWLASAHHYSH